MTRKRKILLCAIVVFVILTILRETGYLSLQYYSSNYTSNVSSSWNSNHGKIYLTVQKGDKDYQTELESKCNYFGQLQDIPIIVTYGNYTLGNKSDCNGFEVDIDDQDYGFLWMPLFKSTSFNCPVAASAEIEVYSTEKKKIRKDVYTINGNITISGDFSVNGFCSHREARKMLAIYVMKIAYQQIKQQMKQLSNK